MFSGHEIRHLKGLVKGTSRLSATDLNAGWLQQEQYEDI